MLVQAIAGAARVGRRVVNGLPCIGNDLPGVTGELAHVAHLPFAAEDASYDFAVLRVVPPSWRPDLTDPADLVEEVVRLEGYDKIPSVLPTAPPGRGLTPEQQLRRRLDLPALRAEQAERRSRGDAKELGIGFSTYVEMCGLAPSGILGAIRYVAGGWDSATIRCLPSGTVQVLTGTSPHGQGHETSWSQITADELGYAVDEIEVLHGDTTVTPLGMDTYGSRSLAVGGIALHQAEGPRTTRSPILTGGQPAAASAPRNSPRLLTARSLRPSIRSLGQAGARYDRCEP